MIFRFGGLFALSPVEAAAGRCFAFTGSYGPTGDLGASVAQLVVPHTILVGSGPATAELPLVKMPADRTRASAIEVRSFFMDVTMPWRASDTPPGEEYTFRRSPGVKKGGFGRPGRHPTGQFYNWKICERS